jgi:hypothetical protein
MKIPVKMLLGLSASCLVIAGQARAQDIVPPKQNSVSPGGVGIADGSFTFTDIDLSIGGLKLERFHLGGMRDPNKPFFGPRMSHNYDIYVSPNRRTTCEPPSCTTFKKPVVHMGLSASGTYYETLPPNVIIQYANDDSLSGNLEYNAAGAYVYTDQSGAIYTFSTTVPAVGAVDSRRVSSIVYPNGQRQDLQYNGSNQLKAVMDSSGYGIVFDYAANGNISAACGYNLSSTFVSSSSTCSGAAVKATYAYSSDSTPKLTSVTDPTGGVTSYTYSGNEIACVTPPGYGACKLSNVYGGSSYAWQVTQQTLIDGSVWHFSYGGNYLNARDPEAYAEVEPSTATVITNPAGKVSSFSFVQSSPYSAIDENSKTTEYVFGGGLDFSTPPGYSTRFGSFLFQATLPELNKYVAEPGPRRVVGKQTMKAKPGTGLPDIVNDVAFLNNCDGPNTRQNCTKPLWKRDAKGNQTDYTYMSNGLPLTEMQPAPSAGAARPLKLHTYVQKYAYIKNSAGSLVPAASAIWMPSSETLCQTVAGSSATTCDISAPITTSMFEYGADGTADNLLVRGKVVSSGGVSLRTCYGYDWMGNKLWETSPRAGQAVCS